MSVRESLRAWTRLIYFLGQNVISLVGAVLTTSSALTMIAFWFYEVLLPGPQHPYIGILIFLILPGIFVLGLVLIPMGIWIRRRSLHARDELPLTFPTIDLRQPMVQHGFWLVTTATLLNLLIIGTASYRGVSYMDSTQFCGETCHTVMIRNSPLIKTRPTRTSNASPATSVRGLPGLCAPSCRASGKSSR